MLLPVVGPALQRQLAHIFPCDGLVGRFQGIAVLPNAEHELFMFLLAGRACSQPGVVYQPVKIQKTVAEEERLKPYPWVKL